MCLYEEHRCRAQYGVIAAIRHSSTKVHGWSDESDLYLLEGVDLANVYETFSYIPKSYPVSSPDLCEIIRQSKDLLMDVSMVVGFSILQLAKLQMLRFY